MSQNLPIQLFGGGFHLNFNLVLKSYVVINIQHCNYFATQQKKKSGGIVGSIINFLHSA